MDVPEPAPPSAGRRTAPAPAPRARAAFGASAEPIRRFAWIAASVMALAYLLYVARLLYQTGDAGLGGESVRIDFTAFWAAAKLAVAGDAVAAFDPARLRAATALPASVAPGDLFWLYPPAWHLAIMPLGHLSFPAAYLAYSALTLAVFVAAARPLAAPLPGGLPLTLAAPGVLIALMLGNISLLWTGGLLAMFALMATGSAVSAGLVLALLTVKPQLGLLIPVALIAGGYYRVALWAALGATALIVVSTAVMGPAYWQHFFDMIALQSDLMQGDLVQFDLMITWFALARAAGASYAAALAVQVVIALAAAAAIAWLWSRPRAGFDLKAAGLCAAIPLATPYAYHYEMMLLLGAALFLARDGFGAGRGARALLLVLWLGPALNLALFQWLSPAFYSAPLTTATLAIVVLRAQRTGLR